MSTAQNRIDDAVDQARDSVVAGSKAAKKTWVKLADTATDAAEWVKGGSDRVRTEVARASDRTVGYVRDEPVRAVLAAAAVGALLFAFVRYLTQRDR